MAKNHFLELQLIEGHFFLRSCVMKLFRSAKSAISPFMEGIARNFDFAASIVDFPSPSPKDAEALTGDWQKVCSDYNNSIKIINEELNGTQKISEK
jgi:hypothetical protein